MLAEEPAIKILGCDSDELFIEELEIGRFGGWTASGRDMLSFVDVIALVWGVWSFAVFLVQGLGTFVL